MTTIPTSPSTARGAALAPESRGDNSGTLALLPGSASDARIAHLFRAARRQGKIHPLQHLIQRHRAAQQAAAPAPGSTR